MTSSVPSDLLSAAAGHLQQNRYVFSRYLWTEELMESYGAKLDKTQYLITVRVSRSLDPHCSKQLIDEPHLLLQDELPFAMILGQFPLGI